MNLAVDQANPALAPNQRGLDIEAASRYAGSVRTSHPLKWSFLIPGSVHSNFPSGLTAAPWTAPPNVRPNSSRGADSLHTETGRGGQATADDGSWRGSLIVQRMAQLERSRRPDGNGETTKER